MVPIVNGYAGSIIWENGATEGVRTPDLWYHKPAL